MLRLGEGDRHGPCMVVADDVLDVAGMFEQSLHTEAKAMLCHRIHELDETVVVRTPAMSFLFASACAMLALPWHAIAVVVPWWFR